MKKKQENKKVFKEFNASESSYLEVTRDFNGKIIVLENFEENGGKHWTLAQLISMAKWTERMREDGEKQRSIKDIISPFEEKMIRFERQIEELKSIVFHYENKVPRMGWKE